MTALSTSRADGTTLPTNHAADHNALAAAANAMGSTGFPDVISPAPIQTLLTGVTAVTANRLMLMPVIIPRAGTLKDIYVGCAAASGNARASVWDCGATTSGSYTRLWDGNSVAGIATSWLSLGDPNLAVTAGQRLMLGLMPDATGITFYLAASPTVAALSGLPASFVPLGPGITSARLCAFSAQGAFTTPSAVTDASLTNYNGLFSIMGRLT
jgi:hypothetical protein